MTGHSPASDHLWLLLDAACDGSLEETQLDELATFLESDGESRSLFADHVQLRTDIRLLCMADRSSEAGLARVAGRLRDSDAGREAADDELAAQSPALTVPLAIPPSSLLLHPFAWLSGSAASSYTFAALVLGAGLLAAWAWRAPAPGRGDWAGQLPYAQPLAWQSPQPAAPGAKAEVVAKITRLRGVKFGAWEHPAEAPADPTDVLPGCLYQVGPGTIEFVYHCGAKVVVEGPARYLVESANSGMLLLGKLTATVKTARDGPSAPLFVIQTRNTILELRDADLRLRTDASGETQADVVRGHVTLGLPGYADGETVVVRANGWAHVAGVAMGERLVRCNPGEPPETFARRLPQGAPVYSGTPERENTPRQQQLLRSGAPDS